MTTPVLYRRQGYGGGFLTDAAGALVIPGRMGKFAPVRSCPVCGTELAEGEAVLVWDDETDTVTHEACVTVTNGEGY